MKPLTLKIIACLVAAASIYGCSTFTPIPRDAQPITLPASFRLYMAKEPGPGNWWQAFGSLELNSLVNQALSGNFDILTAAAKVRQAEAEARKAGADLFPTLDYDGGGETNHQQTKTDADETATSHSKTFSAGLSAGYEVDLWGRLKALKTAELT